MNKAAVRLKTPLGDEILALHAGDRVELSGLVYTARDEAHLRMRNEGIPFDPKGAVIYHCGPVIKDNRIVAAGPTTSARMNTLSGFLLDRGVRGLIGKGGMDATVREQTARKGCLLCLHRWLCSACRLAHDAQRRPLPGPWYGRSGLGNRAERLPLVVGIDALGNDLFGAVREHAHRAAGPGQRQECT